MTSMVSATPSVNPVIVEWAMQYGNSSAPGAGEVGGAAVLTANPNTGDIYWGGYCTATFQIGSLPPLTCGSLVSRRALFKTTP